MKTITVTKTTTEEVPFPYELPAVFKYSKIQDLQSSFETGDFSRCIIIKVEEDGRISQIDIAKKNWDGAPEFDLRVTSCFNISDILKYNMVKIADSEWNTAINIVLNHWNNPTNS